MSTRVCVCPRRRRPEMGCSCSSDAGGRDSSVPHSCLSALSNEVNAVPLTAAALNACTERTCTPSLSIDEWRAKGKRSRTASGETVDTSYSSVPSVLALDTADPSPRAWTNMARFRGKAVASPTVPNENAGRRPITKV